MTNKARVVVVFLVGTLICGTGVTAVFGQNGSQSKGVPHSLEEVLAMLADLGTAVAGLQEDLGHIKETLDTPPQPEVNYRVTPTVYFATGGITCPVTNVSSSPKTVTVELLNALTGTLQGGPNPPTQFTIGPGQSQIIGAGSNLAGWLYCRFTVLDGTRSDIRADLFLAQSAIGGFNPTLIVHAE